MTDTLIETMRQMHTLGKCGRNGHECLVCYGQNISDQQREIPLLTASIKGDIADNIAIEGRSKTDVVQDVWDEIEARTLPRKDLIGQIKREIGGDKYKDLMTAATLALGEMCNTIAPRNSFTDAVDKLDRAISNIIEVQK